MRSWDAKKSNRWQTPAIILGAALSFLALLSFAMPDDTKDYLIWKLILSRELTPENISKIDVEYLNHKTTIPKNQHRYVIDELNKAGFERSNRQGFGGTPDTAIVLYFKNKSESYYWIYGGDDFETSEFTWAGYSHFLVRNKSLVDWALKARR